MVRDAAGGDEAARQAFATQYQRLVRGFIAGRWRGAGELAGQVDDAAQEVFLECLKPDGALARAEAAHGSFRSLLFAVTHNVIRRFEKRLVRGNERGAGGTDDLIAVAASDPSASRVFDGMWADSILREAARRHRAAAQRAGDGQLQRLRILELRHGEGMPIRRVAAELGIADTAAVHNDYRRARREYRQHLRAVVQEWTGADDADVDDECRRLGELLAAARSHE